MTKKYIINPQFMLPHDFTQRLHELQKRCSARTLTENESVKVAVEMVDFLLNPNVPMGTQVHGPLWDRLPNSYKYTAQGTIITGHKTDEGILTYPIRTRSAFGSRTYSIDFPRKAAGVRYIAKGDGVHSPSGSCWDLSAIRIESREW